MANEPQISLQGNLTADSELRYTQSGKAVLNFTVASNPSRLVNDEWQQGEPIFLRCSLWARAELYAEHLMKGTRVYIAGLLEDNSYIKQETGQKVTAYQINVKQCGIIPKSMTPSQSAEWGQASSYIPPATPPAPQPQVGTWNNTDWGDETPF